MSIKLRTCKNLISKHSKSMNLKKSKKYNKINNIEENITLAQ